MTLLALALALVASAADGEAAPPDEPTAHAVVYFNARMALREGQPLEATKLWLLRNALEDSTGTVSSHDADFRSVTWAALGELGICQDGFPADDDGAGLWPLALHNWVVRTMGRRPPRTQRPFKAFAVGQQQRTVSIHDVLSYGELDALHLSRGPCYRPLVALLGVGGGPRSDLGDRAVAGRLLLHLLDVARGTVRRDRVRGWAAIEARRFDLNLQLAELAAREATVRARDEARRGRLLGMAREAVAAMREAAPGTTLEPSSEAARILQGSASWPASEWMSLSHERRLFLWDAARAAGVDPAALDVAALGILDALIAAGEGEQVELWIARVAPEGDPTAAEAVWGGERGERLLALDRESGFRERGVVALRRGVRQLEGGDLPAALRSLAFALQLAPESRAADQVQNLARRWLSFAAARHELSEELMTTLRELAPTRDFALVLEDLMWAAALRADRASFERGAGVREGRAALDRRLTLLEPLASGDVARFVARVRAGLTESPSETLRFLDHLVQRLELEEADVRAAHGATASRVRDLLLPLTLEPADGTPSRTARTATELSDRLRAILDGQGAAPDGGSRDRARGLVPDAEVFGGSVRLAPADPLPWPFRASAVQAPPAFLPLKLTPREWRDATGELVFGWDVGG